MAAPFDPDERRDPEAARARERGRGPTHPSESRLAGIIASATDAIVTVDADLRKRRPSPRTPAATTATAPSKQASTSTSPSRSRPTPWSGRCGRWWTVGVTRGRPSRTGRARRSRGSRVAYVDRYDEESAYPDSALGRLLDGCRRRPRPTTASRSSPPITARARCSTSAGSPAALTPRPTSSRGRR